MDKYDIPDLECSKCSKRYSQRSGHSEGECEKRLERQAAFRAYKAEQRRVVRI